MSAAESTPLSLTSRGGVNQASADTTFSLSGQSIGTAPTGGNRRFAFINVIGIIAAVRTISSVTVDGNSATEVIQAGHLDQVVAGIYVIEIPTGTVSGDVEFTFSGAMDAGGYYMYTTESGPNGINTADTGTDNTDPIEIDVDGTEGSAAVFVAYSTFGQSYTDSGFDAVDSGGIGALDEYLHGRKDFASDTPSHTLSADATSASGGAVGCAVLVKPV
ncbi:MAG: hypothetical protein GY807_20495 [Gammaproteobacteria bacterium]|nr:hypothetical protein [Gammaproteobacteria bacterium]